MPRASNENVNAQNQSEDRSGREIKTAKRSGREPARGNSSEAGEVHVDPVDPRDKSAPSRTAKIERKSG